MNLSKLIWARGNKCSTLHILPTQSFVPAICCFESKANRGGTAKWVIFKKTEVEKIINSKYLVHDGISACKKCIKLAEKGSFKLEIFVKRESN